MNSEEASKLPYEKMSHGMSHNQAIMWRASMAMGKNKSGKSNKKSSGKNYGKDVVEMAMKMK